MSEPSPSAREFLRALVRAQALEAELATLRPDGLPPRLRGPLPVSPGVPALMAVAAGREGGLRDVVCLRRASPAALLSLGVEPSSLAHEARGTASARAAGRSPGGVPDDPLQGVVGAVEPPGVMVEIMAGVALALRMKGERRAALLVDHVDASASGDWHEGLNFAAVRRAPLVLVVDAAARHDRTAAVDRLAARGPAYGIRAVTVEGDDPRLVFDAVVEARARARGGDGTQMVEVVAGGGDPVDRMVRLLPGLADDLDVLRRGARAEAEAAAGEAGAASPPPAGAAGRPVASSDRSAPRRWRAPVRATPSAPRRGPAS